MAPERPAGGANSINSRPSIRRRRRRQRPINESHYLALAKIARFRSPPLARAKAARRDLFLFANLAPTLAIGRARRGARATHKSRARACPAGKCLAGRAPVCPGRQSTTNLSSLMKTTLFANSPSACARARSGLVWCALARSLEVALELRQSPPSGRLFRSKRRRREPT